MSAKDNKFKFAHNRDNFLIHASKKCLILQLKETGATKLFHQNSFRRSTFEFGLDNNINNVTQTLPTL